MTNHQPLDLNARHIANCSSVLLQQATMLPIVMGKVKHSKPEWESRLEAVCWFFPTTDYSNLALFLVKNVNCLEDYLDLWIAYTHYRTRHWSPPAIMKATATTFSVVQAVTRSIRTTVDLRRTLDRLRAVMDTESFARLYSQIASHDGLQ